MAILDKIQPAVLATRVIASVDPVYKEKMGLAPHHNSIGMITADCDDVTYCALDEATKAANVDVVYARSFYAGAAHSSGPTSGEVIGILAGACPADVIAGLERAKAFIEDEAAFQCADENGDIAFFAHLVSSTGSYLSAEAGVEQGEALAYLIAPPLEAMFALDAALKAADVRLVNLFAPPSETNFGGGHLAGSQAACRAACEAFQAAVLDVARNPIAN
ncbi:ethanolamine utilization microcompartment protein EutL [Photobacterium sp. BZF1]|uniref:Ethanolamine utilization microcompartment protein EutL n=1 Tax=Photobacterium rosenbergii TaxID=294936 RepID=A0ABU3ZG14_9GAMM|nr:MULTISPECIES: ethanolamine utilization microcompartment protein EutL [Photobacterium]MBC7003893.1 ethanolamine utilization microcompartment protein EutL [Photobacterium sp. BZF1]MBY5945814.1 ethanolamine utilization microcompartment protein EutL [Photobacterium rosenbergii]MDV5169050.1 ethanolamine utilization microcompartment protein EutL [Photobacterium rosenbergii]